MIPIWVLMFGGVFVYGLHELGSGIVGDISDGLVPDAAVDAGSGLLSVAIAIAEVIALGGALYLAVWMAEQVAKWWRRPWAQQWIAPGASVIAIAMTFTVVAASYVLVAVYALGVIILLVAVGIDLFA